jgi:hypothetical protein
MIDFRAELEMLTRTKLGLPVHGLHFVSRQSLEGDGKAALEMAGLRGDDQVLFEVQGASYGAGTLLQGPDDRAFRGMTACFRNGSTIQHHVFVQNDNLRSVYESEKDRELEKVIQQVLALTHEYGHVNDMSKEINFRFTPRPSVDLARAEAEAHAFAFEHFNTGKLFPLRNLLAKALVRLSRAQSDHEKAMYAALCHRLGKARLKRWAAAA